MKLKIIPDKGILKLHHPWMSDSRCLGCSRITAQAQLEADQKLVDVLELAQEGYTEMAVREILEEIQEELAQYSLASGKDIARSPRWQALKQYTLEKYGGEK